MSGDAIETMAKALYAHENTADNWEWDDETEGFLDDYRQLAAVALSVVRDERANEALRASNEALRAIEELARITVAEDMGRRVMDLAAERDALSARIEAALAQCVLADKNGEGWLTSRLVRAALSPQEGSAP